MIHAGPSRIVSHDVSQLVPQARLVQWDLEYVQVGRGAAEASLAVAAWGQLRFAEYRGDRTVLASGAARTGTLSIVVAARATGRLVCNGRTMDGAQALIVRGDQNGIFLLPADARIWSVTLPSRLVDGDRADDGTSAGAVLEPGIVPVRPTDLRMLRAVMAAALAPGREAEDPRVMRIRSAEIEEWLAQAITCGLDGRESVETAAAGRANRVEYVHRAREYVDSHFDGVVRLGDLARAVGVSVRTLEYAFRDVMGLGPLTYMRTRRLNLARRSLLAGPHEDTSVSTVALDHGFGHFGYFARDYKALFGELPSETLAGNVCVT